MVLLWGVGTNFSPSASVSGDSEHLLLLGVCRSRKSVIKLRLVLQTHFILIPAYISNVTLDKLFIGSLIK